MVTESKAYSLKISIRREIILAGDLRSSEGSL